MFLKEELEAAKKLFLLIHDHRYDFLYKTATDSKDWSGSNWKTVTEGFNTKTQRVFIPKLSDSAMIDVISGKNTCIHSGIKRIHKVKYLSCRFGKYTRYFGIDIDNKPNNKYFCIETIEKILEITKHIGKPVFIQSSFSKGWHLRWYFDKPIKTWDLAVYFQNLFTENGFSISSGCFELFPNKKSEPHALYQGLRLPCQIGSALLSLDDGRVLASHTEDAELFLVYWAGEVSKNLINANTICNLINDTFKNPKAKAWYKEYSEMKEKGFTGKSQTNYLLRKIAKGLIVFESVTDVDVLTKQLCTWMDEKHNGFSEEYNKSPESAYDWCRRWAICALKKYKPLNRLIKIKKTNNTNRSKSANYDYILSKYLSEGKISLSMSQMEISRITNIPRAVIQRKINTLKMQNLKT